MTGYLARPLGPWDAMELFRLTGDPVVTRYLGFRRHETPRDTEELIAAYNSGPGSWRGIWDGSTLAGVIGAEVQGHSAAMAIYFASAARGAGRSISIPFVRQLFAKAPSVVRCWAHCHVDNRPVQAVLRRMGATQEGRLRRYAVFPNVSPEPADCFLYSILRGEHALFGSHAGETGEHGTDTGAG